MKFLTYLAFALFFLGFMSSIHAQNPPHVEVTRLWTTGQDTLVELENEGFETGLGNFVNVGIVNWTTTGSGFLQGSMSATSNVVVVGQDAILNLNVSVPTGYMATLSFFLLADISTSGKSQEHASHSFEIDGTPQYLEQSSSAWGQKKYFITEGNHVLSWKAFHTEPISKNEVQLFLDSVVVSYHLQPAVRIADGSQGVGKLLVSDAHGNATWQSLGEVARFDNPEGSFFLPLILDGRYQVTTPLTVQHGSGTGFHSKGNGGSGILAEQNEADGIQSNNNGSDGIEASGNELAGLRALNNEKGVIASNNDSVGVQAIGNGFDGFYAEGNGSDGFEAFNNGADGLKVFNNGESGVDSRDNTFYGFYAFNNGDDGFHALDNGGDGFHAFNNGGDGFYALNNGGDGFYASQNGLNGFEANNNNENGFQAENNGGVGFHALNNGGDGFLAINNGDDGFLAENNDLDGFRANSNSGDGFEAAGNGFSGFEAFGNGSTGFGAISNSDDGIYSVSNDGDEGYFSGTVVVTGNLSKGGGSFKIDHPLEPEDKFLYHSFVESPDMMNVYNGNVILDENGEAIVQLENWFEALNRDFRYQLTCIGGFAPVYIAEEVKNNRFKIAGGIPGMKVSWQVTGIRQDPYANKNRIEVEVEKPAKFKGYYLHPEAYGRGFEQGFDYVKLGYKTLEELRSEREDRREVSDEPRREKTSPRLERPTSEK